MNLRELSRWLHLASRTAQDVHVATGKDGGRRIVKRLVRRQVRRHVTGPASDQIWRKL